MANRRYHPTAAGNGKQLLGRRHECTAAHLWCVVDCRFYRVVVGFGHLVHDVFIGEVLPLERADECNLWGSYSPYIVDKSYNVRAKGAAYYALQLLTQQWALPGDKPHGVYPVTTSLGDNKPLVTAYGLRRPDGMWSVLVVNKDSVARMIRIEFGDGGRGRFHGKVQVVTFGSEQYHWNGSGPTYVPKPDRGLMHSFVSGGNTTYSLPPQSLTVFRGVIEH